MERLTKRDGKCIRIGNELRRHDVGWDKLADYEDLEENGLLIKLPCKVGTTVYQTVASFFSSVAISDLKITEIKFNIYMLDFIGKSIFLTREEAEQKIKELKGE